jgi:Nif-specific regulatory protein
MPQCPHQGALPSKEARLNWTSLSPENQAEVCRSANCGYLETPIEGVNAEELDPGACRIIRDLTLLFEISQTLETSLELREVICPTLKKMAAQMGLQRGMVTIINRETSEISVDEAYGLPEEKTDLCSRSLKPLLMKIVENGEALVIRDVAKNDSFKGRIVPKRLPAESSTVTSFLCVPIRSGQNTMGTLSVERLTLPEDHFEHDLQMLTIIASVIAQAVSLRQSAHERIAALRMENERLQEQIRNHFKPANMIGSSGAMQSVYHHIEQVSSSNTTVMIRGESGVGKELVAHALHKGSPRSLRAFVKVNCAALPDSVIESELFGHEKGAFTGAIAMRKGRFEIADGGTIFLDEIGDLSPTSQVKLLRVLQEREFERVGGQVTLRCNVRVITATSRDLEKLIEEGRFRSDLYYRLNVFPIYVPALRERKSDMLQLADFFVEKYSKANQKEIHRISTAAIDLMMRYHWPGNVRELENCIERAVLLCRGDAIQAHHLPATLQASDQLDRPTSGTLESAVVALEHEMIVDALKSTRGNMAKAAVELGISERIMGLRVKKYRIETERFRVPAIS